MTKKQKVVELLLRGLDAEDTPGIEVELMELNLAILGHLARWALRQRIHVPTEGEREDAKADLQELCELFLEPRRMPRGRK